MNYEFSPETSFKCPNDPLKQMDFLRCYENYYSIWIHVKNRPLLLSIVLDDLGLTPTEESYTKRWEPGDQVSFGLNRRGPKSAFLRGENCVTLHFNCRE